MLGKLTGILSSSLVVVVIVLVLALWVLLEILLEVLGHTSDHWVLSLRHTKLLSVLLRGLRYRNLWCHHHWHNLEDVDVVWIAELVNQEVLLHLTDSLSVQKVLHSIQIISHL